MKKSLSVILLVVVLFALVVPVAQAGGGTTTAATTVKKVSNNLGLYRTCNIRLSNGRSLYGVTGSDCDLKPGTPIVLQYKTVRPCIICRPGQILVRWDSK